MVSWLTLLLVSLSTSTKFALGYLKGSEGLYFGKLNELYYDEGIPVDLRFLTKLRSRRDLKSHPYHIIDLYIPSSGRSYPIHLVKNENLVVPNLKVTLDEQEDELEVSNCLYSGTISGFPGGTAALSACDGDNGFSGHILLGDEHFVLEPASQPNDQEQETSSLKHHRLYRSTAVLQKHNGSHSDMRRVPKDELKKAVEQMANSTSNGETEDEDAMESDRDDDSSAGQNKTEVSEGRPNVGVTTNMENDEEQPHSLLQNHAMAGNVRKSTKNNKAKKKKKTRTKQITLAGRKTVEIAIFTDSELYKLWTKRYPNEAKGKLKAFVLNLVNNMNLLYQQPSLGQDVIFRLVHLEIMSSDSSGPNTYEGESEQYLKSFCKYAGDKNSNGANWDHALLITGVDLKDGSDKRTAGLAWFSTMCLKYWSCSISEGFSFASNFVIAHEIGHSLGMEHDGEGTNTGCSSSKYIMSPYTGAGKVTWSTCSSSNLKDFITKGSSEQGKEEMSSIPACVTKVSPLKAKSIRYTNPGSKLPGEFFKANVQCQYDCGTSCSADTSRAADFCRMLACKKSSSGGGTKISREAHPALEGTACGSGKFCKGGKCVKTPSMKSTG